MTELACNSPGLNPIEDMSIIKKQAAEGLFKTFIDTSKKTNKYLGH